MEENNLLINRSFVSHSGNVLPYKIECDALTDDDINTVAAIISANAKFDRVIGIPTGGIRLQFALGKYLTLAGLEQKILIVDDVYTTGASMEEKRQEIVSNHKGFIDINDIIGWVIFARGKTPDWINAVFTVTPD